MWDGITYPFLNLNAATVEVYEWISNFIPHITGHVITGNITEKSLYIIKKYKHIYSNIFVVIR